VLLSFFEWAEGSALGEAMRNSLYAFAITEAIHLLGLCMLGGAVLIVDLRLLGVGLKRQPIPQLLRSARPWLIGAIIVMISTGVLLFVTVAIKLYYNTSWWVKITGLPIAILFTFLVRERLILRENLETSTLTRVIGAASIGLWFTVAAAGRWIGFS
jgi:hypothetical protein